ncbi:MAG: ribosome maturation factor RimM [Desulfosalsimonadaceae bacterium]
MDRDRVLQIGKVVGVFGLKGELKVFALAEEKTLFDPGRSVLLREPQGLYTPYTVSTVKPHKNILRICFEGIGDRTAAETLVGSGLFIARADLPETDADTWYWCDLIGLEVYGMENNYIGRVTSMIETGSNDVFVVTGDDSETLIPAIASVVVDIDLENGRMRVELPEGL